MCTAVTLKDATRWQDTVSRSVECRLCETADCDSCDGGVQMTNDKLKFK